MIVALIETDFNDFNSLCLGANNLEHGIRWQMAGIAASELTKHARFACSVAINELQILQSMRIMSGQSHNVPQVFPLPAAKVATYQGPITGAKGVLTGERTLIKAEVLRRNIRMPQSCLP